MARRFFVHFDITETCMTAGLNFAGFGTAAKPDVLDHLAEKMRGSDGVRQMLEKVGDGTFDKVCVGVGREVQEGAVPRICWRPGFPRNPGHYFVGLADGDFLAVTATRHQPDEDDDGNWILLRDSMDGVIYHAGDPSPAEGIWGKAGCHFGPIPEWTG